MYLALYRKWRPRDFDDVIGQEPITTTLKNEVAAGKTAHSYLFTGSRGTGKTTCSKVLAKAVNCLHPINGNPCMECEVCKGIEDGSILDVMEIDAASNNGVDDVRILREEANYTPTQCKYRVYIIDETHMLSTSAFNALLKIMEEPPPHVKFILATTEVHKVPATVLSRCQRFDFVRIKTEDIAKRLLYIADHEDFTLTEEAAFLIARLADGGMRDALSILDQCTAFSDRVEEATVSQAMGLISRDYLFEIAEMIRRKRPVEALDTIDRLYAGAKDLQKLISELIEHFRNLMVIKAMGDPKDLVRSLPEELEKSKQQAARFPLAEILRILSVLQDCLDRIGKDYEKRLTVEMAMIRLCSPDMDDSKEVLLQRIETLENRLEQLQQTGIPAAQETLPFSTQTTSAVEIPVVETEKAEETAVPVQTPPLREDPSPKVLPPTEEVPPFPDTSAQASQQPQSTPAKPAEKPLRPKDVQKQPRLFEPWVEILGELTKADPAVASVLSGSVAYALDNVLYIDSPMSLFGNMNQRESFVKNLVRILEQKTGVRYKIRMKKAKEAPKQADPLEELEKQAKELGISIESLSNL